MTETPFAFVPDFDRPLGEERSLVLLCVDRFKGTLLDGPSLEEECKLGRQTLEWSVFWLRDRDLLTLGASLGMPPDGRRLARAAVRDLVSESDASSALCGELRYCRSCLLRGWHSALFQHWALPVCPVHLEHLRCGCPDCGSPIAVNLLTITRALMTCDQCGSLFERRALVAEQPGFMSLSEMPFAAYRKSLPARFADVSAKSRLLTTTDARMTVPLRDHDLHRFQVWPSEHLAGYRDRRVQERRYPKDSQPLTDTAIVEKQVVRTLEMLQALLVEEGCFEDCPSSLACDGSRGFRIDGQLSTGAAAFWKTAHVYRIVRFLLGSSPKTPPPIPHFGYGCFQSAAVWRHTLEIEVISLFARLLVEIRARRCLIEVDWERVPERSTFLPAWRLFDDGSCWLLQVRGITDIHRLRRLIRRCGGLRLWEVPKDRSLLASIQEAASAEPQASTRG